MKELVRNCKIAIVVLLVLSVILGTGLVYQQRQSQSTLLAVAGENRASLRDRYAQAGTIYSRDLEKLAYSEEGQRHYTEDPILQQAVMHTVGDYTHHITNTIETLYQGDLLGNNRGIGEQLLLDVLGRGIQGSDVYLTINSDLNRYMYEQLQNYHGAAVLLNYETGDILGMTSTPSTMTENVIAYRDIPDTGLFNRAIQSQYPPASTFKILTAAAWIQSPQFDPEFSLECTGHPIRPNGARDDGHGHVDLNKAFAHSCNVFFGELAVKMGHDYFTDYLEGTGIANLRALDKLRVSNPRLRGSGAETDVALLSWMGTGQPVGSLELTMSPLHLVNIAAAIANGGSYKEPHIVDKVVNPMGNNLLDETTAQSVRMFSPQVAIRMQNLMRFGVEDESSVQYNARISGVPVAGKSGTLEIGIEEIVSKNGLWTGYIADEEYPYAIAVVTEDVRAANSTAVLIAKNVLERAIASGVQ